MDRRSFFSSLKTKTKKITSSSCYEVNFNDETLNIFNKNPNKPIFLIDSEFFDFKNIEDLNFCYLTPNKDKIKAIKSNFKQQSLVLISSNYQNLEIDSYVLINQEKNIGKINEFSLFSYDYNYLETAQEFYSKQTTKNKDIFISQLIENNKLTEAFINRLRQF